MEAALVSLIKPRSNYLDPGQLADYWSAARFNHHTRGVGDTGRSG
jgi:hypothetical protein